MVSNAWASTWKKSALEAAGIESTDYALKALALWQKSTPLESWTMNPLGIPARGYARRKVPNTEYALFLKYSDFSAAFAKAMASERSGSIKLLLQTGESTAKLWREIHSLAWPAAATENDWPREVHTWIGDEFRALLNIPDKTPHRSSGVTAESRLNNHRVIQAHRAMITAAQTKQDLRTAILFITKGRK